jgi:sec-independent protein translocase protein TatC
LPQLAFFGPAEAIVAYMKVAVAFGIAIAMPMILWQCWSFIRPGLTRQERQFGVALIQWGGLLFLAGCAFAYWVLLPMSLRFLMQFGSRHLVPVISVSQYLSFTTTMILVCGAIFEVPIVVFLLARLGFVTPALLKRQWRQAVLAVLVASALITPTPDIVSMLLVAVPMLALYEASIWVAGFGLRG